MADDFDQTQHGSTTGQALSLIGSLIGGASGRPLGSGLMALGNLVNQKTYDSWEIQNRQKNEIPMFQKHLNLTDDEVKYLGNLPRQQYEAAKGTLLGKLFAKQKEQVPTAVFNTQNGQESFVTPKAGMELPQGEVTAPFARFLQPGQAQGPKNPLELFMQDPAKFAQYEKILKQSGAGTGEPKSLLELWETDRPAYNQFVADQAANKQAGAKQPTTWRWTTKDGRAVQVPFKYDPAKGELVQVPIAGEPGALPARLNATQQKQVDSIREVAGDMPLLQKYVTALPPNMTSGQMLREYAKYRAHGHAGKVDPRFADYFDLLGQMKPTLLGARIGGLSRSQAIIQQLSPHIPDPLDTPDLAMEKMRAFDAGAFKSSLEAIAGPNAPSFPSIPSSLAPTGKPPKPTFAYTKIQQNGDNWRVLDSNGRWRPYDWASGQWQ